MKKGHKADSGIIYDALLVSMPEPGIEVHAGKGFSKRLTQVQRHTRMSNHCSLR